MAIGWFALLKHVPWAEVINKAPAVADGAKKLWSAAAAKRARGAPVPGAEASAAPVLEGDAVAQLQAQVAALQAATAEMQNQMLESSALIKSLAEQNAELIARVHSHRMWVRWLTLAVAVVGGVAALLLAR